MWMRWTVINKMNEMKIDDELNDNGNELNYQRKKNILKYFIKIFYILFKNICLDHPFTSELHC